MKNLANCKPTEFLKQTNLIRKSVSKWLDVTQVMSIRRNKPYINDSMSEEEVREATQKQISKNLRAMLDSVLEKHPDETLEILALMCFVDPADVDNYTMSEYLQSFNELINNRAVVDFLSSLMRLDRMNTSDAQNQ